MACAVTRQPARFRCKQYSHPWLGYRTVVKGVGRPGRMLGQDQPHPPKTGVLFCQVGVYLRLKLNGSQETFSQ